MNSSFTIPRHSVTRATKNLLRHSPITEGLFSKLTKSPTAEVSGNDFPNYTLIQFCTILTPFSASLTLSPVSQHYTLLPKEAGNSSALMLSLHGRFAATSV